MLDSRVHEKVQQYIDLLKEYNETTNIYSKKSYDILDYHIADSLNLAELIKDSSIHVDMGSGSGLPGIILAIASNANIVCIESKEKKRVFLNYAKEALDLDNLDVFDGDVQLFTNRYSGRKIQSFSAKAFAKPPKLLTYLSMFRPHQYKRDGFCWVPVSIRQAELLKSYDDVLQKTTNGEVFYYFKIRLNSFRSYKADLKMKYNL
ncbi:MAG: RsmG family class I SAM-dependent methyltransferase [Candidatus Margulisiibacteriota bacterium]|nr:RsmG family class I SAM-dependent methyltransferase [Candidatus Margulisiibacteriota bacterium]